jgi:L-ascorbate metabolism protein UlaG (beta-lactamase superfamily)
MKAGIGAVNVIAPGDRVNVDGVDIEIVPALHEGVRAPWTKATGREQAIGFVLHGETSIYFPGDTDIFDEMSDIGPVDIALLPIGGWWKTLGPGHLNPERAVEAAKLLQATTIIPIHWGTFRPIGAARLVPELRQDAARLLMVAAKKADLEASVVILQTGDSYDIP